MSCKQVVLEHVAEAAGFLVVPAPMLHAQRLGGRDLNVIDVLTIPDRLDDRVGKPKGEDVLDGVLPEIVIDPIDLFLVKGPFDRLAERPGAGRGRAQMASR